MSARWKVVYYVSMSGDIPVRDFLNTVTPTLKAKALRTLMHVEEYGLQAIIPHIKKLSGTPLWEIRIIGGKSIRIVFITEVPKQVVLLHAFYKKTQKTPPKEITTALSRLKDHLRRSK